MSADAGLELERGQHLILHPDLSLGDLEAILYEEGAGSEVTEIKFLSPRGTGAPDNI